jgi:acetyl-CoA hydrolase
MHTEMFSDGIVRLVEAGVVNNERKTLHRGKIVASFMLGTRTLYQFVDNNPLIELHPSDYVNDPFVISRHERMVAINSALQVDLTGQVCADSLGHRNYSGFGGQLDFIRGAARSRSGKAIIALPATARGGTISRLVPVLSPGSGVTTTRADVHYVVTEHGVAHLFGRTIRERARALIAIADPRFRDELRAEAAKLNYL